MLRTPVISGLLRLEFLFGIFQVNAVMITIIAREVLHVGPEGLGGLLSAPAIGSLLGVGALLTLGQSRRQGRFTILCMVAYAGTLVVLSTLAGYEVAFAALVLIGLFDALMTVTRHSVMYLAVPGRMRGRVMGNMGTITRGVSPLAETQSGVLSGVVGPRLAILVAAVAMVASAGATARRNPALWCFTRDDVPDEELEAAAARSVG
jgi:hypothetical protein